MNRWLGRLGAAFLGAGLGVAALSPVPAALIFLGVVILSAASAGDAP